MNISKKVLLLLFIVIASILSIVQYKNIQAKNPEVSFCAPTKKEAFDQAMYYIRNSSWFIQNKYQVDLPQHEAFTKLYKNPETVLSYDENHLRNIFYTEIYDSTAFDKGLKKIQKTKTIVENALEKVAPLHGNWGFKLMPQYEIILTLYGPGGRYNSRTGQVIMKTTPDGTFHCYNNVATTIIHEIVHIGIEENIVNKYKLTQNEKERLVDLICSKYLQEFLPEEYRFQERGDINIDPFILRRQNTQRIFKPGMNGRRTLAYSAEVATKAGRSLGEVGLAMKNFACYHAACCVERFISEKVIFENLPAAIEDYVTQYPR